MGENRNYRGDVGDRRNNRDDGGEQENYRGYLGGGYGGGGYDGGDKRDGRDDGGGLESYRTGGYSGYGEYDTIETQSNIDTIAKWTNDNQMLLNADKSNQGCGAQLICTLRSLCAAPGRKYEKQCALRSGILCAPACALRFYCALSLRLALFCHVRFYT